MSLCITYCDMPCWWTPKDYDSYLIHPGQKEEKETKRNREQRLGLLAKHGPKINRAPCRLPRTLAERPVRKFEDPRDGLPAPRANLRVLIELEGATWSRWLAEKSWACVVDWEISVHHVRLSPAHSFDLISGYSCCNGSVCCSATKGVIRVRFGIETGFK